MNEMLNREFAVSVGAGLALLGFGLIIMDFVMARLVSQLDYPEYKITEQELLAGTMPEKEKRRIRTMQSRRNAALTHRMRRGALVVIALACCILLTAWLSSAKGN
jgi:hypothetical protein